MENMLDKLEKAQTSAENITGLVKTIESAVAMEQGCCNIGAIIILSDLLESHAKNLELILNLWQEGHRA